jgi:pyridoxal phosphate enzyme (YggS family)
MMSIAERYQAALDEIREACVKAGRTEDAVRLVAVSKYSGVTDIEQAYEAGCRDFGENRVQDWEPKRATLPADIRWHLIGSLQRKKIPKVLGHAALIHAVDSLELAERIGQTATRQDLTQPVLLQVNVSGEASKHGLSVEEWREVWPKIQQLPGLEVKGLMTMAPQGAPESALRQCFAGLREFRDELGLTELSMGMSQDFRSAIEEGATLVRIGSAIFR